jgi:hypothetical protein
MYWRRTLMGAPLTGLAKYDADRTRLARQQWARRSGKSCRGLREGTPFSELVSQEVAMVGGKVTSRCTWFCLTVELAEFAAEVRAHVPYEPLHPLHPLQRAEAEHLMPVLGDENQAENAALPACLSQYPAI